MTDLVITFSLFILFSLILVPIALTIGLRGYYVPRLQRVRPHYDPSMSWVLSYLRGIAPGQIHQAERSMQDMTAYVGLKTKEVGERSRASMMVVRGLGRSPPLSTDCMQWWWWSEGWDGMGRRFERKLVV